MKQNEIPSKEEEKFEINNLSDPEDFEPLEPPKSESIMSKLKKFNEIQSKYTKLCLDEFSGDKNSIYTLSCTESDFLDSLG